MDRVGALKSFGRILGTVGHPFMVSRENETGEKRPHVIYGWIKNNTLYRVSQNIQANQKDAYCGISRQYVNTGKWIFTESV